MTKKKSSVIVFKLKKITEEKKAEIYLKPVDRQNNKKTIIQNKTVATTSDKTLTINTL